VSRAHCPVCDRSVVLEPTGTCPEGHLVATPTATLDRFELLWADEPEPWVFGAEPVRDPASAHATVPAPDPGGRDHLENLFDHLLESPAVLPVPAGSPTAVIDLGNFTARGATVGAPTRRRRFRG
jgi:hypothetical protein